MRVYQAGPLFTEAERLWHRHLKAALEAAGLKVVWPGELFDEKELADMGHQAKQHIFEACRDHLEQSDVVVALLDGTQVDDGTAWEIGYAYARGIPVHGIRTDFRNAGDTAHSLVNCMIECACVTVEPSVSALVARLAPAQGA
ncbi:nucleoside 2-deoxyribosyltransferase [Megalodesulfovibrio paquesii]